MNPTEFRNRGTLDWYWTWGGALAVLVVATCFNFVNLDTLPPGLDPDAAANGMLALKWLRQGNPPFWIPHASAAEPLMIWLQSLTTLQMGASVLALRSVSAAAMVMAAATAYWLGYEIARGRLASEQFLVALFSGLGMASSVVLSELGRTGLRATLLPAFSGLTTLFLLVALRKGQYRYYALAGVLLGVTAYTYLAARFLPVAVFLFVLLGAKSDAHIFRRNAAGGLALLAGAAFIIVLPQLVFFVEHPAAVVERAQAVTLLTNPSYEQWGLWQTIGRKVLGLVQMFGIKWSGQYNQSFRPLLSPLLFGGLLIAIPTIVRRRKEPGILVLALTLPVMLLPDLIGGDRQLPHELRVSGCFVPTLVFCGLGLAQAVHWLSARFFGGNWQWLGVSTGLILIGWNIVDGHCLVAPRLRASDYFWYSRQEVAEAEFISASQRSILVPLVEYSRSVVAYLSAQRVLQVRSGIDGNGEVYRPANERTLLLWPEHADRGRTEAASYLADVQALVLIDGFQAFIMPPPEADIPQILKDCPRQEVTTPISRRAALVCEVPWDALEFSRQTTPQWESGQVFGDDLKLLGVTSDKTTLAPGESLGVTGFWTSQGQDARDYRYFVHLLSDDHRAIAGEDLMPAYGLYQTGDWAADEVIPIRQLVRLPANLSAGRYWLEMGWYDPFSGERLPTADGDSKAVVGPLKVPLAPSARLADETAISAQFSNQLALRGYRIRSASDHLDVSLRWQAMSRPERDYTIFLHLESGTGEIVTQADVQPLDGTYPTTIWDPGEIVLTQLQVPVPRSMHGTYKLWGGLYYWQNGERLTVEAPGREILDNRLLLDTIVIP